MILNINTIVKITNINICQVAKETLIVFKFKLMY